MPPAPLELSAIGSSDRMWSCTHLTSNARKGGHTVEALLQAFGELTTTTYWITLAVAIGIGTAVGFIPGVGATLVTAIMLPSVLLLIPDPAIGIVFLAMIGSLNNTLDSIPAVLVGVPGSETQVTYLEGHQLARQGKAAHTLGAVYAVSAIGGVVGAVVLALVIPVIKPFILQFSYTEIAMLALFGVAMVALLSKGSMSKGLTAGALGLLLGTVGVDPFSGADRFTFGHIQLWQGLPVITVILGFFALPELIDLTMSRQSVASADSTVSRKEVFAGFRYGLSRWRMAIRQSLFGTFMGTIPGIGGSVIDWLSYAFGISLTKDKTKHRFGKGSLEGVMFAEAAANSKAGGQALPTLTLGIPGSTSWAIIAAAMLSYGFSPGPSMVAQHQNVTMLMVITLAIGNIVVAMMGLLFTNRLARITRIPYPTVGFLIMGMVVLAAYIDLSAGWLVFPILIGFTFLGLLMKSQRWPRPPLILGFILGPIVEQNLLSALSIYGVIGVITRPVAIGIVVLLVVSVVTLLRVSARAPEIGPVTDLTDPDSPDDGGPGGADGTGSRGHHGTVDASDGSQAVAVLDKSEPETLDLASPESGRGLRDRVVDRALIGPLFFLLVGGWFAVASAPLPGSAKTVPMATSLAVAGFSLYQLGKQLVRGGQASQDIMDLGMQSTSGAGARSAAWLIAALFSGFFLVAGTVGLQAAAVALSTIGPLVFLKGRPRWISAAISGLFVWSFSVIVMERIVGILWPEPFMRTWFG